MDGAIGDNSANRKLNKQGNGTLTLNNSGSVVLNGTGAPKTAFYHHDKSIVVLLRIDTKRVTRVADAEINGGAEGMIFSPDGRFLYVGSYTDGTIVILRLQGDKLMPVGSVKLPGHPAALGGAPP